jgi:N-acetylmuramoyl-L-alanine amidase
MNKLKYLMIHCTASQEGKALTADDIRREHTSPPPAGRGWKQVGYADTVLLDGKIVNLVPYDQNDTIEPREITNGSAGMNSETRHISYVGGIDKKLKPKDTRTEAQKTALEKYVYDFLAKHPTAKVLGHNQVAQKACPSFDVPKWLIEIGINKGNIY